MTAETYVEFCDGCGELASAHAPTCTDLGAILDDIRRHLARFVSFTSSHQGVAIALWVAQVYGIDAAPAAAYLHITSAAEESGKTTLLEVLAQLLGAHAINAVSASPASVFRFRDRVGPIALLLDEIDHTLKNRNDDGARDLLAIINAGYRRSATVLRTEGKSFTPHAFRVFGPAVIAGIGQLPATTESRCLQITLTRKPKGSLERFIEHLVEPDAAAIASRLEAWSHADGTIDRLRVAAPSYPEELRDRQVESWWLLLAIADEAGGSWPELARAAASHLHGADETVMSNGVLLLDHIRAAFEEVDVDRLSTARLIGLLVANEEGPWGKWWGAEVNRDGAPRAAATDIARHLKGFGVKPKVIKLPDRTTPRGYLREQFKEAWSVYLPPRNQRNRRNPAASEVAPVASVAPPTPRPTESEARPLSPSEVMTARVLLAGKQMGIEP